MKQSPIWAQSTWIATFVGLHINETYQEGTEWLQPVWGVGRDSSKGLSVERITHRRTWWLHIEHAYTYVTTTSCRVHVYLWWSAIIEEPVKQNEEKFWTTMKVKMHTYAEWLHPSKALQWPPSRLVSHTCTGLTSQMMLLERLSL